MAWQLYVAEFPNGKKYFGITSRGLVTRARQHRHEAKKGSLLPFHRAIRKYGTFELRCLAIGEREEICALEISAIAEGKTQNAEFGYNLAPGGNLSPMLGRPMTEEIRAKLLVANKGRKQSPEQIAKRVEKMRGRKHSLEHNQKIANGLLGHRHSAESRAKMSAANLGRKHSEHHREATRQARLGKRLSPETRAKIAASLSGKKHTAERTANFTRAVTGLKRSPEERAAISLNAAQTLAQALSGRPAPGAA